MRWICRMIQYRDSQLLSVNCAFIIHPVGVLPPYRLLAAPAVIGNQDAAVVLIQGVRNADSKHALFCVAESDGIERVKKNVEIHHAQTGIGMEGHGSRFPKQSRALRVDPAE